jgi:hypothetical protein
MVQRARVDDGSSSAWFFLTGKYHTAVGDADGIYDLVGRVSLPADENRTLGFVVAWQNDKRKTDSVTTWSVKCERSAGPSR